jgi:hypothetical protein
MGDRKRACLHSETLPATSLHKSNRIVIKIPHPRIAYIVAILADNPPFAIIRNFFLEFIAGFV